MQSIGKGQKLRTNRMEREGKGDEEKEARKQLSRICIVTVFDIE
jgi:hypothetical protein